jgi:hypothetical protein
MFGREPKIDEMTGQLIHERGGGTNRPAVAVNVGF